MAQEHGVGPGRARRASREDERATDMVFVDPASRALESEIARVAPSNVSVLIHGETGVGKEIVARHVHAASSRSDRPFVAVNCAAVSETLFESEMFGYEKGAFTGAVTSREGWLEAADGGTLLLDEVGELPLAMQAKLLRVVQEREVARVGARVARAVDIRLLAATNVDLAEAVQRGRFREDLFYRLRVATLDVPPLRERPGDILPLVDRFLLRHGRTGTVVRLGEDARQALLVHEWPGNVRELENVVQTAMVGLTGDTLTLAHLRFHVARSRSPVAADRGQATLDQVLDQLLEEEPPQLMEMVQRRLVDRALALNGRNQVKTAESLGITRNVLRTYLARFRSLDAQH